jgi:hypothetical protein
MIRRVLAVLAASIAVTGATASAALAEYPPTGAGGAVSATTVAPGGHVEFSGGGFKSGSKVTIAVNDAVYATDVANQVETTAFTPGSLHLSNAAYARPAAAARVDATSSFSVEVTLDTVGTNVLTGTGVDATGAERVVSAKVVVAKATGTPAVTSGSSLPFTGSSVVLPGAIVGLAMLGGGFLLLTSVRSRRAGGASS